jgi:hypothetical protein
MRATRDSDSKIGARASCLCGQQASRPLFPFLEQAGRLFSAQPRRPCSYFDIGNGWCHRAFWPVHCKGANVEAFLFRAFE